MPANESSIALDNPFERARAAEAEAEARLKAETLARRNRTAAARATPGTYKSIPVLGRKQTREAKP